MSTTRDDAAWIYQQFVYRAMREAYAASQPYPALVWLPEPCELTLTTLPLFVEKVWYERE